MAAIYTPPAPTTIQLVISNNTYTPPTNNQVNMNLLILTEPVPVFQNVFFLQ